MPGDVGEDAMAGVGVGEREREVKSGMPRWRVAWWRSVGFWLGLWGLAFLVWVWVDSYANVSRVVFPVTMEAPGYGLTSVDKEVTLQGGRVFMSRARISEPPAGITVSTRKPVAERRKGSYGFSETAWWGMRRWVDEAGNPFAGMSVEVLLCWFSFGFVVLGYGVVWAGVMMMWRRWMRRRWRVAQVM